MTRNRLTVFYLFIISALITVSALAQKSKEGAYSKEFTVIEDNDFLLLQSKDGYYTNGMILKFSTADRSNHTNVSKKINTYELGQLIFTQQNRRAYSNADIDRPVAGYLYGKFTQSFFLVKNRSWHWGASVGTIGEASFGRNVHSFYHRQININSAFWGWNWDYQVKEEVGANIHSGYAASLLNPKSLSFLQITPQSKATLGTSFTNITTSVFVQLGKFNRMSESGYWGSRIANKQKTEPNTKKEVFIFYHPELMYQVYNATIQGGLFRKDKGPIISSPQPFVLLQQVGVAASTPRLSASFNVAFQTKEASSQRANHSYGRVNLSYRFR